MSGSIPVRFCQLFFPSTFVEAIHEQMQGQGLGGFLLADALLRVAKVANIIGCFGVIVDSKDETAEAFYTKFGFVA